MPISPKANQAESLHTYLQAIGNSSVTISENAIFKKGILDFGFPINHPNLLGYRVQAQYEVLRGMKTEQNTIGRRAVLKKAEIIDQNGRSIGVMRSKDGAPPTNEALLLIPQIVDSMGPITLNKIVKKEISILKDRVAADGNLTGTLKPKITRLENVLNQNNISATKKALIDILKTDYQSREVSLNNERIELEIFLESRTLDGIYKYLGDFFLNPSKNMSKRAFQESLQSIGNAQQFKRQRAKLKHKNFWRWMVDRTKRQFGNAPSSILIGVLAGAIGAALTAYFGGSNFDKAAAILQNTDVEDDKVIVKTPDGPRDLVIHAKRNGEKIRFLLVHKGGFDFAFEPINIKIPLKFGDKIEYQSDDGRQVTIELNPSNLKNGYIWP